MDCSSDSEDEDQLELICLQRQKQLGLLPVELAFGEPIDDEDRFRLNNYYFPLGKIGGRPEWLSWKPLPTAEQLACKVGKLESGLLSSLVFGSSFHWTGCRKKVTKVVIQFVLIQPVCDRLIVE